MAKKSVFYYPKIAIFKAVIIAVDMPAALQTKLKACFGGSRIILKILKGF